MSYSMSWTTSAKKGEWATLVFGPYSDSMTVTRAEIEAAKFNTPNFVERRLYEYRLAQATSFRDPDRALDALRSAVMKGAFLTFKQIGHEVITIEKEFGIK